MCEALNFGRVESLGIASGRVCIVALVASNTLEYSRVYLSFCLGAPCAL